MARPKNRVRVPILGSAIVPIASAMKSFAMLHPNSAVAHDQRELLFIALALMMVVVVPVWVMAIWFPWKYRAGNKGADYRPRWSRSFAIESVIWALPGLIVVALATLLWIYTHRLDPYKTTPGEGVPLQIQAVSLDWKWLFIYPDQKVATIDDLVVPAGRPVTLRITSDTVMNSLFVPGLVGQIFAMAGMETRLNFTANHPGEFRGRNTQYSAGKFPDEHFVVRVVPAARFTSWADEAARSPSVLDQNRYRALADMRGLSPHRTFALGDPQLFHSVIAKYCSTDCPNGGSPGEG